MRAALHRSELEHQPGHLELQLARLTLEGHLRRGGNGLKQGSGAASISQSANPSLGSARLLRGLHPARSKGRLCISAGGCHGAELAVQLGHRMLSRLAAFTLALEQGEELSGA